MVEAAVVVVRVHRGAAVIPALVPGPYLPAPDHLVVPADEQVLKASVGVVEKVPEEIVVLGLAIGPWVMVLDPVRGIDLRVEALLRLPVGQALELVNECIGGQDGVLDHRVLPVQGISLSVLGRTGRSAQGGQGRQGAEHHQRHQQHSGLPQGLHGISPGLTSGQPVLPLVSCVSFRGIYQTFAAGRLRAAGPRRRGWGSRGARP